MANQDEKKPPLLVGVELTATELVDETDLLVIRLNARTPAARFLLGGLDATGRNKVRVIDATRTPERDPETGGYPTTSVTLMFSR